MSKKIAITPEFWGPILWDFLHYLAKNVIINRNNKLQIFLFLQTISYILPCNICSLHYKNYLYNENILKQDKISKLYLIKWICELHNSVNSKLDKKIYTFEQCKKRKNQLNNIKFFIFINIIFIYYSNKKLSINHFNQIKQFFISLSFIYPDTNIRNELKKNINNEFKKIYDIKELKKWYFNNKDKIYKKIKKNKN